jgi:hypothetical protein
MTIFKLNKLKNLSKVYMVLNFSLFDHYKMSYCFLKLKLKELSKLWSMIY